MSLYRQLDSGYSESNKKRGEHIVQKMAVNNNLSEAGWVKSAG